FLQESRYRSIDGSNNNFTNSDFGRAGEQLSRQAPAAYADGIEAPAHPDFPNPRFISNTLLNQTESIPDERQLSDYVWVWGQFIDHDMIATSRQQDPQTSSIYQFNSGSNIGFFPLLGLFNLFFPQPKAENINITIPENDPVYKPGSVIPVTRSIFDPNTGTDPSNPRQQTSNVTAWIDASMIYGSDEERASWLRTFEKGKLKVSPHKTGDLLPFPEGDRNAPAMDNLTNSSKVFVAGDARANENVAFTSLNTVFVREHNRLAELIDATHKDLPTDPLKRDEEIYQRARKLVGAEIQAITYNEFLPALGVTLDPYTGYDHSIDPSITNEFATVGFRMGHTQTSETIPHLKKYGSSLDAGSLELIRAFFNPSIITKQGGIEPILRGLAAQVQEATDTKVVDSLRNLLFVVTPSDGPVANGTDLAALDIQRGRDHGLSTYNDTREAYGLDKVDSFEEITSNPEVAKSLETIYGDVDQIDPLIGMLAEDPLAGSSIGELNEVILEDQFERLRDGDRFWYQNDPDLISWSAPQLGSSDMALDWLKELSLSDIIELNTNINNLPDNLFFATSFEDFSAM
ncbi:peroxidase family protein, partial [Pleurocapsales cyanobacterium LEGE 06147]|nr:peroxidase family protein [Pleurocapsales cyanobacterium LEGE 06147]